MTAIIDDFRIDANTESLDSAGNEFQKQAKIIEEGINEIQAAVDNLTSWKSENNEKYARLIHDEIPKMQELPAVIKEFGRAALVHSGNIKAAETEISRRIDSAIIE